MDGSPEKSPKEESGLEINQSFETDVVVTAGSSRNNSRSLLQSCELGKMSGSEGNLALKAMLSEWMTSFYEARTVRPEYEDEDDELELELDQFSSFPKRRTFSQCDSPIDPLPECKIYDSEADNTEEMGSMDREDFMKKFILESAAYSKIRRRFKPTKVQRERKSDEVVANMSRTSATEISTRLSRFLLKRSLSAPSDSSFESRQKQNVRIRNFFNRLVKSAMKSIESDTNSSRMSSFETKPMPNLDKTDGISECASMSEKTTENLTLCSSGKTFESCSEVADEFESSGMASESICTNGSEDTNEPPSENAQPNTYLGKRITKIIPSPELEVCSTPFYGKANTPGSTPTSKSSCSSKYSEISCSAYGIQSKHFRGSVSTHEITTSDISEIPDVTGPGISTVSSQCTKDTVLKDLLNSKSRHPTQISDASKQKSDPQIASESPTVSIVAKLPKSLTDPTTPKLFDLPGPSTTDGENAAIPSGSTSKRPTDLNVRPRSAFYSFCATSPTGLTLRPYRSLPNVHGSPVKNKERTGIVLENRRRRVVRSLFTGNFCYRGYTPRSNTSSVSKEIIAVLERRPSISSSEERPSQSKKYVQKVKARVCKKLVFTSLTNGTNVNQTFQDHSSSDLIVDVSSLNLNDPSMSEDPKEETTPKRKEASPFPTDKNGTPVKKPRSSFELDVQDINVHLTEIEQEAKDEESANILKPPSCDRSTTKSTSPKRKAGDLEDSKVPIAEDLSLETVSKRTKMELPTLVDEVDICDNLHQREKETKNNNI